MVGTSGSAGQRVAPVTASALMAPALICGSAGASVPELNCTVPPSTACSASPPPANTMVAIWLKPSRTLNTSASSCGVVPIGGVETLNRSGLALASATNSFIVLAASSDLTVNTLGEGAVSEIGAKSLNGS